MPPKRKRKAQLRSKRTGKFTTKSAVSAGPSSAKGSSVDSVDAAPPQKKTKNTGTTTTTTTPRVETTTEDHANPTNASDEPIPPRVETTAEGHANPTNASDEPDPRVIQKPEKTGRSKSSRPNPYTTLPAKTTSYIQLRFQLMNFANVYRIVKLPVTFTFANLHTLIQYMFGWSNSHLHRAEVVSYVVMHDPDSDLAGTIKRWGRKPTLGEYLGGEEEQPGDRISWKFERDDNPIYHVDERGVRPQYGFGGDYAKSVKDSHLKLGEIWTKDFENNASLGESPNEEIGIIYEYDFGDTWTVHISCNPNELFFESAIPINSPVIDQAKGAPPIEHAPEYVPGEEDANDKTVSNRIFAAKNFELYCEGKLMSCARRTELAIYTAEEEAERQKRLQREREERMDVDSGEENYDECDDDDSGEWY